ncbi:MAG: ABC transporter permease [Planctomycetaceae bacterium]
MDDQRADKAEQGTGAGPVAGSALSPGGVTLQLRDFSVTAGGRVLLHRATDDFPAGRLTLLLGCSGVGKSVLLRILAGLIDPRHPSIQYSGGMHFRGAGPAGDDFDAGRPAVSVVFQQFALFDELSPVENVRIALDHAGSEGSGRAGEFLSRLQVPTDRPVAVLSGGQQQRLAIARAVAPGHPVILYDEPTSGLDVATAADVADLIRETHEQFRRTSIVVTHDYASLSRIADRILLLNHRTKQLEEVLRADWGRLGELTGRPPEAPVLLSAASLASRMLRAVRLQAEASGQFVEDLLLLPVVLLPRWKSPRWGLCYARYYLLLVAGPSACLYIAAASAILGYVAQDFVFRYLPFRQFSEPLLVENLLHATGFSLFRFLVPILATLLIAARSGAAVAADVGSRTWGNRLDALRSIGASPDRLLRTPILYAFLIGTPLLSLLGYFIAAFSAGFAFLLTHSELGLPFWDAHFHKELLSQAGYWYNGSGWLVAKLLACAAGIAVISWRQGSGAKLSTEDISRGVTRTILWSTLFVLTVHFLFSFYEFEAKR